MRPKQFKFRNFSQHIVLKRRCAIVRRSENHSQCRVKISGNLFTFDQNLARQFLLLRSSIESVRSWNRPQRAQRRRRAARGI